MSVEDQQDIYKLAMDVCEYIFEYDSHSDNGYHLGYFMVIIIIGVEICRYILINNDKSRFTQK